MKQSSKLIFFAAMCIALVAAAAYRSGEKITNEWDGMIHDYTRKRGIVHSEILLPPRLGNSVDGKMPKR